MFLPVLHLVVLLGSLFLSSRQGPLEVDLRHVQEHQQAGVVAGAEGEVAAHLPLEELGRRRRRAQEELGRLLGEGLRALPAGFETLNQGLCQMLLLRTTLIQA